MLVLLSQGMALLRWTPGFSYQRHTERPVFSMVVIQVWLQGATCCLCCNRVEALTCFIHCVLIVCELGPNEENCIVHCSHWRNIKVHSNIIPDTLATHTCPQSAHWYAEKSYKMVSFTKEQECGTNSETTMKHVWMYSEKAPVLNGKEYCSGMLLRRHLQTEKQARCFNSNSGTVCVIAL